MGGLIEPNIHPILVHFAYALTITAIAAYLGARLLPGKARRDGLTHAGKEGWRGITRRIDDRRNGSDRHGMVGRAHRI